MTDGMSMALATQQYSLLQTLAPEAVNITPPQADSSTAQRGSFQEQRYDEPLPPGRDADFKPLLSFASKVSDDMQAALNGANAPVDKEIGEAFPQLQAIEKLFHELRELSLVEMQFTLIGKSLQLAESNVRQLYQQQG